MANQYPGPPPEQPPGQPGQNPYAAPPGGPYAEGAYGYPTTPGATPVYGYPQAAPQPQSQPYSQQQPQPGFAAPLLTLGDIAVNGDTIVSPAGPMPLRGAVWTATDMSRTEERIPPHAIVLAILFFLLCFIGLLFLLMKERTTTGFVQVSVNSGGRHHSTMIPVQSRNQVVHVLNQVSYAQSISM
ncbi:hypothetical protein [Streptomyces sp. NPDC126522]|uniref:hypothetical protein n=1 Tax=Streptomyces sp. NPDC126522 TaxID=3155211 RepID=UPI00332BEB36